MTYLKILSFTMFCLFFQSQLIGQEELVKADDGLLSILGDAENAVTKATVQTQTERSLGIQIEFKGFKDKKWNIKGEMLNSIKHPIKEIAAVEMPLESRSGVADFQFAFKQQVKEYKLPYIESHYFRVVISDANSALGSLGLSGSTFVFKCKKKFKVTGAAMTQVVDIKLTPYKSAQSIKQN